MTANKMVSIGLSIYMPSTYKLKSGVDRGRRVKGATNKDGAKDIIESKPARGAHKVLTLFKGNSLVFLLNDPLIYIFPSHLTFKKDCGRVKMRGTLLAKRARRLQLIAPKSSTD